jgi:hypothetical protein
MTSNKSVMIKKMTYSLDILEKELKKLLKILSNYDDTSTRYSSNIQIMNDIIDLKEAINLIKDNAIL